MTTFLSQVTWGQFTTFVAALLALTIVALDAWFFNHALGSGTEGSILWLALGSLLGTSTSRPPVMLAEKP